MATDDAVTFILDERHLATLGIEVSGARGERIEPPAYTFAVRQDAARRAARYALRVDGGLALSVHDVHTGVAAEPLFLFDFAILASPDDPRNVSIRTADPHVPAPLQVRSGTSLREHGGELQITEEWAQRLGRPELAGHRIGTVSLSSRAAPPVPVPLPGSPDHPRDGLALDLELSELYQLVILGREGTFPAGTSAFSVVTTVCNTGAVPIPWVGPGFTTMGETHPFLSLAMYRESPSGVLEMIGTSWLKHSYNTLPLDKCGLGCASGPGGQLNVGCSDTYSTSDNAATFYLGPREELDPYAATWEFCGSYFDGVPEDCDRSYFGFEPSVLTHRMTATDADLDVADARFFYEAVYYVADDVYPWNGAGWRECALAFLGNGWVASTLGGGNAPAPGPLAASWGDKQSLGPVARNDGEVVLSVSVTPLGGGQWRYEYVLFNWRSREGVGSLEIPVGTAAVSNVGFRDLNASASDDWTATVANGAVRWSTTSQPLPYHTMFNFRFDADAPPGDAVATAEAFQPELARGFPFATHAPSAAARDGAGATAETEAAAAVPEATAGAAPALAIAGANPARAGAIVTATLPRAARARVTVTDAAGRTVRVLADRTLPAGRTELRWDGRAADGAPAAAGVYFVRLIADGVTRTEKITRLR
ncbi:MAG TPA: FlgD immunoglobulin-like domain containing protein [bacterium]|nr:FlgD immunoglobulin-like domain containing protein [bacterium]